jgi:hypothetical protein
VALHADIARLRHEEVMREAAHWRRASLACAERRSLGGRLADYVRSHRPRRTARYRLPATN